MSAAGGADRKRDYKSVAELWSAEVCGDEEQRKKWYAKGAAYWQEQEPSINGVLGGFSETHAPDIRESRRFVDLLRKAGTLRIPRGTGDALDCGAGIGRVTAHLLRHEFGRVDLAEPNVKLLDQAKKDLAGDPRAGRFIAAPLQHLQLEPASYDAIWIQWVLLYLPDDDLAAFLQRCKRALRKGGVIFVKENVVLDGNFVIDREDNSVSRADNEYKAVFEQAGLHLEHQLKQTCWPTDLFPVKMYALRPTADDDAAEPSDDPGEGA
eukprot:CAMPEP_0176057720 /NCGR_PEP_ID=MMETSP0120_2-20121206/28751_1 /TAXON_ID=160619 /ORGANISM="Kryptoperidinium foliaceum, Strain CCMP 1326" /LENGTH=265 /DNA_ID=CAMNT_0017391235 /DNA_START=26 /DNA_END=820 /DNA_ORIENTATION=-